jgi:uncharacterized membrane protein (DUF106 family)
MVDLKKHGGIIAIVFVMLMMVTYAIESIRITVGAIMDAMLGPLLDVWFVPFFIVIVILSSITGLYSSLVQKYTIDYERMQEVQVRMKEFQKEFREAQLSGDEKKIKKLEGRRDRMMQEQLEMSRQQFQPMAIILVISVPIFFWLLFRLPELGVSGLSLANGIVMPFVGAIALPGFIVGPLPAWILWYMICSLTISQVIRKALNIGGL